MTEIVTGTDQARGPDATAVMIRCNAKEAVAMCKARTLAPWLRGLGLETRTMGCRADGADLVYEGRPITKTNAGGEA